MNIRHMVDVIEAGGPGSGCNPDAAEEAGNRCGRPPSTRGVTISRDGKPVREKPIRVNTVMEAIKLIEQGKVVELKDANVVHTLLDKLAYYALRGQGKTIDMCQVTVAGTNLFCVDNKGVPRIKMPQTSGKPRPGSEADKLPKNARGRANGKDEFIKHLKDEWDINVKHGSVPAAYLRSTQREISGSQVVKLMNSTEDLGTRPIFVSRDNYVVDGHHRWAAIVGRDAREGKFGNERINVMKIDAPVSEILKIMGDWADSYGFTKEGVSK